MAHPDYFKEYFKEFKIISKLIGIWPYDNGIKSKIMKYVYIIHLFLVKILMVI